MREWPNNLCGRLYTALKLKPIFRGNIHNKYCIMYEISTYSISILTGLQIRVQYWGMISLFWPLFDIVGMILKFLVWENSCAVSVREVFVFFGSWYGHWPWYVK